ncbi:MAG TPA: response regulator [Thermodesulfovibrionia bacterium]|nr:response regulator [Thermodesulfovibrionia bacterium]
MEVTNSMYSAKEMNKDFSILFIDDEFIITFSMVKVLKRRFANVYSAGDGQEGLELFRKYFPDIVITDILMPKMDGLEMTKNIRKISPDTPVIVLTAINEEPYIDKIKEIGIQGYIVKPINDKDFFNVLYKAVDELYKKRGRN